MTKAEVDPGVCGFRAVVEVTKLSARRVRVIVTTDCETVRGMNQDMENLDLRSVLRPPGDSIVYKIAAQHISHAACPLPMAILKAIEVELDIALPRDVTLHFEAAELP